jgi:hypothetical protein
MTFKYIEVEVEVDMSDFTDEDIEEEYEERFGKPMGSEADDLERLQSIYHAMRLNKPNAHDLMWDYIRDRLGVAV